ncbi:MAG: hypothetical protein AAF358_21715 [Pseudomonadota bacterium]
MKRSGLTTLILLLTLAGVGAAQAAGDSIFIFDLKKADKDQLDKSDNSKAPDDAEDDDAPKTESPDAEDNPKSKDRPT